MGIQRFTQDLSPYAEAANIGRCLDRGESLINITGLIIDGPSFAYHVYNKLLAHRLSHTGKDTLSLPTCAEMGEGARRLLLDLSKTEVDIKAIFFDGFLPAAKQPTRLARMETTRKQLEDFRHLHMIAPLSTPLKNDMDYNKALWSHSGPSTRRGLPPPPPFLVPAVIEGIKRSQWASCVHIVAEEADIACARLAQSTGAAILSNDSDMCIYDLGNDGCVLQLHTLERHQGSSAKGDLLIRASCIRPAVLVQKLKISSLLRLAYERQSDGSASYNVILEAAKSTRSDNQAADFNAFAAEYDVAPCRSRNVSLDSLDPRVAEFVATISSSGETDPPTVYLPMLYEDPQRDAAWCYGQEIRQVAYSIVATAASSRTQRAVEYFRKGTRVAADRVQVIPSSNLERVIDSIHDLLSETMATMSNCTDPAVLWYLTALRMVIRRRLDDGRNVTRAEIKTLFEPSRSPGQGVIWSSVHLHANVEALLYSLRVLKQLTGLIMTKDSPFRSPSSAVRELAAALEVMPPIAELFLPIQHIQEQLHASMKATPHLLDIIMDLLPKNHKKAAKSSRNTVPGQEPNRAAKRARSAAKTSVPVAAHRNLFDVLSEDT